MSRTKVARPILLVFFNFFFFEQKLWSRSQREKNWLVFQTSKHFVDKRAAHCPQRRRRRRRRRRRCRRCRRCRQILSQKRHFVIFFISKISNSKLSSILGTKRIS